VSRAVGTKVITQMDYSALHQRRRAKQLQTIKRKDAFLPTDKENNENQTFNFNKDAFSLKTGNGADIQFDFSKPITELLKESQPLKVIAQEQPAIDNRSILNRQPVKSGVDSSSIFSRSAEKQAEVEQAIDNSSILDKVTSEADKGVDSTPILKNFNLQTYLTQKDTSLKSSKGHDVTAPVFKSSDALPSSNSSTAVDRKPDLAKYPSPFMRMNVVSGILSKKNENTDPVNPIFRFQKFLEQNKQQEVKETIQPKHDEPISSNLNEPVQEDKNLNDQNKSNNLPVFSFLKNHVQEVEQSGDNNSAANIAPVKEFNSLLDQNDTVTSSNIISSEITSNVLHEAKADVLVNPSNVLNNISVSSEVSAQMPDTLFVEKLKSQKEKEDLTLIDLKFVEQVQTQPLNSEVADKPAKRNDFDESWLKEFAPSAKKVKRSSNTRRAGYHARTPGVPMNWNSLKVSSWAVLAIVMTSMLYYGFNMFYLLCAVAVHCIVQNLAIWISNPIRIYNYEKDRVYLFLSEFENLRFSSLYIQIFLKLQNVPYQIIRTDVPSPRGDYPFIELNGETISGPEWIVEHITSHFNLPELALFSDNLFSNGCALERMLTYHLIPLMEYFVWFNDDSFKSLVSRKFKNFPFKTAFGHLYRAFAYLRFFQSGFLSYTQAELEAQAARDIEELSLFLGGKYYTMGVRVSQNDALLYAFLKCALESPIKTPINKMIESYENLVRYHAKMTELYKIEE
jgi:hypothetical protein